MIKFVQGNLLESPAQALVNTVNTVGVMGKGIALIFKEAFPENFLAYERACKRGEVVVGRMFVTENQRFDGTRWIINFPTKQHWRNPSKLEWIVEGLQDLRWVMLEMSIESIALPPLGCGNGGLDWNTVRPIVEDALSDLPNVEILVFEPTHQSLASTERPGSRWFVSNKM